MYIRSWKLKLPPGRLLCEFLSQGCQFLDFPDHWTWQRQVKLNEVKSDSITSNMSTRGLLPNHCCHLAPPLQKVHSLNNHPRFFGARCGSQSIQLNWNFPHKAVGCQGLGSPQGWYSQRLLSFQAPAKGSINDQKAFALLDTGKQVKSWYHRMLDDLHSLSGESLLVTTLKVHIRLASQQGSWTEES